MPNDLLSTDPIVAQNFYLELDDASIVLSSVSGLDLEMDVVSVQQNGAKAKQQMVKTLGGTNKASDLTVTRMAPMKAMEDPIWKWFNGIRDKGFAGAKRADHRKSGSIVLYDTAMEEVGRYNFYGAWPYKISTSEVSTESTEPMKETITLAIERLERKK